MCRLRGAYPLGDAFVAGPLHPGGILAFGPVLASRHPLSFGVKVLLLWAGLPVCGLCPFVTLGFFGGGDAGCLAHRALGSLGLLPHGAFHIPVACASGSGGPDFLGLACPTSGPTLVQQFCASPFSWCAAGVLPGAPCRTVRRLGPPKAAVSMEPTSELQPWESKSRHPCP